MSQATILAKVTMVYSSLRRPQKHKTKDLETYGGQFLATDSTEALVTVNGKTTKTTLIAALEDINDKIAYRKTEKKGKLPPGQFMFNARNTIQPAVLADDGSVLDIIPMVQSGATVIVSLSSFENKNGSGINLNSVKLVSYEVHEGSAAEIDAEKERELLNSFNL